MSIVPPICKKCHSRRCICPKYVPPDLAKLLSTPVCASTFGMVDEVTDFQRWTPTLELEKVKYWSREQRLYYFALGLTTEAGECGEKVKKLIRDTDGHLDAITAEGILKEAGDVLYYLSALLSELSKDSDTDLKLIEAFRANRAKLEARKEKGTLSGSGDDR